MTISVCVIIYFNFIIQDISARWFPMLTPSAFVRDTPCIYLYTHKHVYCASCWDDCIILNGFCFCFPSMYTGSPGMLTPSFNAVHGLASPLATSFANTPVTSMPLGFTLPGGSLAAGTLRLPGQMTGQTCVLLVSNLNEEVTETISSV